jgi:uncharacterized protein (TIGR01619 family)
MGLFNKLLGKKEAPKNENQPLKKEEEWDTYFTRVDDKPGSIFLDMAFHKIAPVANYRHLVWIVLTMKNPSDEGLSGNEESETLYAIEDRLVENLQKRHQAQYPGRLTSNNIRTFYFYLCDLSLYDRAIAEIMVQFPNYDYDYGTKEDENWGAYFNFLYPLPDQLQIILNGRVIRNLEKNGDQLEAERMVDHWIYFKTVADQEKFSAAAAALGFTVLSKNLKDTTSEFRYELNIGRLDKVDYSSVNNYVLDLWELANQNNGSYDGWGCPVVKNN